MDLLSVAAAIGVPVVSAVVWLVRLEGRINTEKELRVALEARLNGFEGRITAQLDKILDRLESKADK
jgi:hypothetical protein